jgi:hypothetical protein
VGVLLESQIKDFIERLVGPVETEIDALLAEGSAHPIEAVGARLRGMMKLGE